VSGIVWHSRHGLARVARGIGAKVEKVVVSGRILAEYANTTWQNCKRT
jgi:hypothetical protein